MSNAKRSDGKKSSLVYKWKRVYHVISLPSGRSVLVKKSIIDKRADKDGFYDIKLLPVIAYEEQVFDIISKAHESIGHGKSQKTHEEVCKHYSNVSRNMVDLFLTTCSICSMNKKIIGRPEDYKPILSTTFNDRGQLDLIDMQAVAKNGYRYIFHYQDHLTKFSYLRALKSKSN